MSKMVNSFHLEGKPFPILRIDWEQEGLPMEENEDTE
jgi:hypothetical protein